MERSPIDQFVAKIRQWAVHEEEVESVILVGSWARGTNRSDSDVDLVLLSTDRGRTFSSLIASDIAGPIRKKRTEIYGACTSLRVFYDGDWEIEYGVVAPSWADLPLEEGTERVLRDGYRVLIDKKHRFGRIILDPVVRWLLDGDVSIQYMTRRFLLGTDPAMLEPLRERIATEGFGARFLSFRNEDGHWGRHYYQPKWTSTHYTLTDLRNLWIPPSEKSCRSIIQRMFDECQTLDGGLNLSKYEHPSDVCVDGMVLDYASYFCPDEPRVLRLTDFLLSAQKADGGFTWDNASDQGDPPTTVCVLEGMGQFLSAFPRHREQEIRAEVKKAVEFLLSHGLFLGNPDERFRKLSYPPRYRYDLLRVLDCFLRLEIPFDSRMQPALDWLKDKRKKDGFWHLENQYKGNVHFLMENLGEPSRFLTLKALLVLCFYGQSLV